MPPLCAAARVEASAGVKFATTRTNTFLPTPRTATARPPAPHDGAKRILAERYARGEIDEHEYADRLATLRGRDRTSSRPRA